MVVRCQLAGGAVGRGLIPTLGRNGRDSSRHWNVEFLKCVNFEKDEFEKDGVYETK